MDGIAARSEATKAGPDSMLGSITQRRRLCNRVLFAILAVFAWRAARDVGYLFGWIVGASLSPVGAAVAPLVFGLLAALGFYAGMKNQHARTETIIRGIGTAFLVSVFCFWCDRGIKWGTETRDGPYTPLRELLRDPLMDSVGPEVRAKLYAFQLRAARAEVPFREYESFIVDVVEPILEDKAPDKVERLDRALGAVEAALPTPRDADEKGEPARGAEPATADRGAKADGE